MLPCGSNLSYLVEILQTFILILKIKGLINLKVHYYGQKINIYSEFIAELRLNCVILFSFSIKLDSWNRKFPASWVQHRLFKYSSPVVAPSVGHQTLSPLYLDHHRQLKCNQNCFKAPETQKHLGFKWNYSWQIEFQDCVFWITFTFSAFNCFL